MDYGKVLGRAWQITWRWKILWILGFLASLGTGSTAGNPSYSYDTSDWGYTTYGPRIPPEIIGILVGVGCLVLILAIAVWVISTIARGGLIAGVQQVEDEGSTGFGQAWRVGARRFWTLFGISILTGLPTFILLLAGIGSLVVLILLTVSGFETSDAAGVTGILASVLCGGTLCCGAILLSVVLAQIRIYAERAAVLEGLGWIEAFMRGWQVLKENLGPTLVLWLIFLAIGLVIGFLIFGGLAMVIAPLFALFAQSEPGVWLVVPMCFGGLLGAIVFALISSVVETFTSATWTVAYRELTGLAAPEDSEIAEMLPAE
jgi:hypothetical protein